MSRIIALDTETTGISTADGHRIIEIGCVEIINRKPTGNYYHTYINPCRAVDEGAFAVHGLSDQFLSDKPVFRQVAKEFLTFIQKAELVIHNAPFDTGFINHEFKLLQPSYDAVESHCTITDTLAYARKKHMGQKNSLDALCRRYHVDNSNRTLHGALLDAELLAEVYLLMTGGQTSLILTNSGDREVPENSDCDIKLNGSRPPLKVIKATAEELSSHRQKLKVISEVTGHSALWETLEEVQKTVDSEK